MLNLRPVRPRSFSFLSLAALSIVVSSAQAQFNPLRTFPDTTSTIGVFVDQLPGGMTAAQNLFAATHYAGTQKLTTTWIDPIRAYNPNFLMLQYRLGDRDSGDTTTWIHNNTWSSDWSQVNTHENWFVHINGDNTSSGRLYQAYGSTKEWIMDVAGLINSVPMANSYGAFWTSETIADATASHADGTFADADMLPWAPNSNSSPIGGPPCLNYAPSLDALYQYVYQQYTAANMYFIPNVDNLTLNADTSTRYRDYVHGDFMENFAVKNSDWTEEKNRTLSFLNNGKIWIAQNYLSSNSDVATRKWYLTNYLLVKSSKSYINVPSTNSQLYWWPEYNLALGSPTDALPTDISSYAVGNGIYLRHYQNGIVLVNASSTAKTYTFAANDPRYRVAFSGGGNVDANGNVPAGSLTYTLQTGGTFSISAWSGEVFTVIAPTASITSTMPAYIYEGRMVSMTATASGGTAPLSYRWTQPAGQTQTLTAPTALATAFTAATVTSIANETLTFQFVATDSSSPALSSTPVTTTVKCYLCGDISHDNYVNVGDLQLLVVAWASYGGTPASGNWNAAADLNNDGYVNVGDLQLLVANWGRSVN